MRMRRLTVASHNAGKVRELSELLEGLPVEVRSLEDFPAYVPPEETGATFAENAALKAQAAAQATGGWALADDSGLGVAALGGAPGVRSARVAANDPERIAWLLGEMAELPEEQRGAEFVCALALADEQGQLLGAWEGRAEGRILRAPRGSNGFGYDPVFLHDPEGKTFAELTSAEKALVSHRGQALRAFREWLTGEPSPQPQAVRPTEPVATPAPGDIYGFLEGLDIPTPQRILIVRRSSLGDVIVTLPVLVALRRAYPQAYIAWLVEDRFADLVTGHECLDEVITIARSSGRHPGKWLQETQRVGHLLREKHFDLAIDMQGRQKSALMAYLSGAPRRVGFRNEFRGVLGLQMINEVVPFEEGVTAVERSLLMAAHLFAAPEPVEFRYPLLPEAQGWAEGFLEAHGLDRTRLIALVLGASHPNKCWPAQHFARLIGSLRAEGLGEPLLLGGKVEAEREAEVQAYLEKPAASAVGRTSLPQLAALLARSRAVVAGDTGALHMAVALDRPVVGLYGPTSPRLTGPYGMGARVLWNEPPCGPCVRNPTCSDFHCMREILPERVRTVLRELLRSHA